MDTQNDYQPLIELREVIKAYQTPAGPVQALKGVNLVVEPGEFAAVIGKSGSGKSTLINMITGIDRPTSGQVLVNSMPVHQLNESQVAVWRGRNLGVVFQFFQLLPTLTLLENIMLPMEICDMYSAAERIQRAKHLIELVGLAEQSDKFPAMVSGGQQQRIAIARALANDPPLIVADEPTGSLDSRTAESIFRLFEELVENGKTILMVTHDNDLAVRANRTIVVSDGNVINRFIKSVLPDLDLEQLIRTSAKFEHHLYPPGEIILREGEHGQYFQIITQGQAEVLLDMAGHKQVLVAQLAKGDYFGEMELVQGGVASATVRAGQQGLEVTRLVKSEFQQLLAESDGTRQTIQDVVEVRAAQNRLRLDQERSS